MSNPVLVESWRGDIVENRHRGAIAVCDPAGRLVRTWGDVEALVYPRSSLKLLQALPLVETGAADHYRLDQRELALACSSHGAEPMHTDTVQAWLARLDLDEDSLECGPHAPSHEPTAQDLARQQRQPGRVHNNCSGKHSGMLTTCRFMGEPTRGYIEREHPAQQRWFDSVGEMAGIDMRGLPWNRDGCGIPVIAMPLVSLAGAFARVAVPDGLPPARAAAIERLAAAIAAHPLMIAGHERLCSEVVALTGRRLLVKTGADGVYTAALQDPGLGIAIKMDDGSGAAAQVALLAVLRLLGALREDDIAALEQRGRVPIVNTCGVATGYLQAAVL